MADSNQEKQDQSSSLEDSTAMTIEFLRARLLSERSVSKSARQRADELDKRVAELEEQLRIVSLQRKLAEKATVDVLSILDGRGIGDAFEPFDSGSDHDTNRESNEGNDYQNGEDHSVVSKRRSGGEELSGSDLDSSPIDGRSLSWKGRNDSSRSRESFRDPSGRRRISSVSSSSPRNHLGKSCRQIRRRETRVVVEERKTEAVFIDSQENKESVLDCSDSANVASRGGSESTEKGVNGHLQEQGMEKALEDQAQLIGRYEEMEKAQREWEEKFRENNSTPDSYDPGNHSDVTEEQDEVKAQTPSNTGTEISQPEAPKAGVAEVIIPQESLKPQPNGFSPLHSQEFTFPTGNKAQARPENGASASLETGSSSRKTDLYAMVPHNPGPALGGVLDALKQAKLQLQHKMTKLPLELSSTSSHRAVQPSRPNSRTGERVGIPVGSTGLFRLPTDFAVEEADSRADFLAYRSTSAMAPYYPNGGFERRLGFPQDDQFLTSSRGISSLDSRSDRYFDAGPLSVNRYDGYNSPHRNFAVSPEVMPQVSSGEGFSRTFPREFGAPVERLSFHGVHGRPDNMYR